MKSRYLAAALILALVCLLMGFWGGMLAVDLHYAPIGNVGRTGPPGPSGPPGPRGPAGSSIAAPPLAPLPAPSLPASGMPPGTP